MILAVARPNSPARGGRELSERADRTATEHGEHDGPWRDAAARRERAKRRQPAEPGTRAR